MNRRHHAYAFGVLYILPFILLTLLLGEERVKEILSIGMWISAFGGFIILIPLLYVLFVILPKKWMEYVDYKLYIPRAKKHDYKRSMQLALTNILFVITLVIVSW